MSSSRSANAVRIANRYRDAIFVCIHFNSATRAGANGIETYYYSNNSAALAANIHRQVVSGTTSDNRGIRRRGYYVLRSTSIPAVLVECGFLTNPTEARLALQSSYRQRAGRSDCGRRDGKTSAAQSAGRGRRDACPPPIRQPSDYNDFVRAEPERQPTHRTGRSKETQRKKSSSSKKKRAAAARKRVRPASTKKKKKTADSDE